MSSALRIPKLTELEETIESVQGIIKFYRIEVDRAGQYTRAILDTTQYDMTTLSRLNLIYPKSFWGGSLDGRIKTLYIDFVDDKGIREGME